MKLLKILNYKESNIFGYEAISYKTLDINQFIPGSQLYPLIENWCAVATTEISYTYHKDIIELTEQEYLALKKQVQDEINNQPQMLQSTTEERVNELEQSNAQLMLKVAMLESAGVK